MVKLTVIVVLLSCRCLAVQGHHDDSHQIRVCLQVPSSSATHVFPTWMGVCQIGGRSDASLWINVTHMCVFCSLDRDAIMIVHITYRGCSRYTRVASWQIGQTFSWLGPLCECRCAFVFSCSWLSLCRTYSGRCLWPAVYLDLSFVLCIGYLNRTGIITAYRL